MKCFIKVTCYLSTLYSEYLILCTRLNKNSSDKKALKINEYFRVHCVHSEVVKENPTQQFENRFNCEFFKTECKLELDPF